MLANPPFGVEWKPEKDHVTTEHNDFGFRFFADYCGFAREMVSRGYEA
jgi:hypothetical protein